MYINSRTMLQNRHNASLASAQPHTVGVVVNSPLAPDDDDDDDNDICPVCDGECTCHNASSSHTSAPPSSSTPSASTSSAIHPSLPLPKPPLPSLKIKLTVPKSMLGKRRPAPLPSKKPKPLPGPGPTSSPFSAPATATGSGPLPFSSTSLPKRRGRPPKLVAAARALATKSPRHLVQPSHPPKSTKLKQNQKITKKLPAPSKRRRILSSGSSDLSDVDHTYDSDDLHSGHFPTFVSASALSSISSNDSDSLSSASGFDTDSSIEAEEENFIVADVHVHDKARVRRELLGNDSVPPSKRDNDWVIRPRKSSVGPTDAEMDVDLDSDATEDDDDDDDDDDQDQDEPPDEDEEETDGHRPTGAGYVGVATGWSDDDESSFDADLFFANLSDSDATVSDGSSTSDGEGAGDDGDQSDLDTAFGESSIASLGPPPDNLRFEVTEGWDGQIVFTNGLREGQGMLDIDFEAHTAQFITDAVDSASSPSHDHDSDSDVHMSEPDDGGYEEDGGEGEGDTTDEELVGDDDLPNERAMRLFSLPFSVSAINPMSTMSPTVSPSPLHRTPFGSSLGSPGPAEILAGKVFWDEDEREEMEDVKSRSLSSPHGAGPRKGSFEPVLQVRQAVIDDSHKDVPSPHPRFRGRGRMAGRLGLGHHTHVEHILRKHLLSSRCSPLSMSMHAMAMTNSSSELEVSMGDATSPDTEMPPTEPIDLDDVLEASFLDASSEAMLHESSTSVTDAAMTSDTGDHTGADDTPSKHMRNLSRWDLISVGAFRQTRETGASTSGAGGPRNDWGSSPSTPGRPSGSGEGGTRGDYGSMMKSSPLSTMLWPSKERERETGLRAHAPKRSRRMLVSPLVQPVRDGDRTPIGGAAGQYHLVPPPQNQHHQQQQNKTRKELRRERKMQRKGYGVGQYHQQGHGQKQVQQRHHVHQHHPNLKTRSSSSSQRSGGFFSAGVPPLNL